MPFSRTFVSTVVTTNYDNSFETFCYNSTKPYEDFEKYLRQRGFKYVNPDNKFCLQYDLYDHSIEQSSRENPSTEVLFLKLHGSIDWWKNKEGTEIILSKEGKSYGKDLGERLMIYPIHDKYISEFPFCYTYNCFRNMLKNEKRKVVVIGYSFRDEFINNAFKDKFLFQKEDKNEFEIIICNKSKGVIDRVKKIFNEEKYKIKFVEYHFGDKYFIKKLSNELMS